MGKGKKTDLPPDERDERTYVLKLFITGTTPQSGRAIVNLRTLLQEHLKGRYKLEVIDLKRDPTAAQKEQIIAAPTLVKMLPLPLRRFIGDMSNSERLLIGLNISDNDLNGG
jgi:circadian clock protein KaiB